MLILDLFNLAGAVVAFSTGTFVLYDQITRKRPAFLFVVEEPRLDDTRNLQLRVINRSDRILLVRGDAVQPNGHLRLMMDKSIHSSVGSAMGLELNITIDPNSEKILELMQPSDYERVPNDHFMKLVIKWAFVPSQFNISERTKNLYIKKSDVVRLKRSDGYKM